MAETTASLAASYRASLATYLSDRGEDQLEAAYRVGREAFAAGMTLLELVDMHGSAVTALLEEGGDVTSASPIVAATFEFLTEALATFEMTQRGYSEAQEHARWEREQSLMLQRSLLPSALPEVAGVDVAVRYLPGETGSHAGGDWYDVFELDAGQVGLVVGDISGHGVGAAAAMGQLRIAVLAYAIAGYQPAGVVGQVDQLLQRLETGDIATLVYVVVDPGQGTLSLVNAGHPPPLLISPRGDARILNEAHARLIGVQPAQIQREQRVLQVTRGSRILLYTDGLIEPLERQGVDGLSRLLEVTAGFHGTADELCDHVLSSLAPDGARDDICIVAATLASGAAR